jgi:hypothetical protein
MAGRRCSVCGWPAAGASCEACGASGEQAGGEDDLSGLTAHALAGPQPEDYPNLRGAFVAWRQKDHARMVGQCLVALGVEAPQVTNLPSGPGWSFALASAVVYLSIDSATSDLAVESPLVRLAARLRVPMMRALLELNESELDAARFCLRGDLVVLRFADRMQNLSPPKLVAAIREVALSAVGSDDLLSIAFSAKMIGPEAKRHHMGWQYVGTPRKLGVVKSADVPREAHARLSPPTASATPAAPAPATSTRPPAPSTWPRAPSTWPPAPSPSVPATSTRPPSGRGAAVEESLRHAAALCELLRRANDLTTPLYFAKKPVAALLLQRAAVMRAFERYSESCPDAVALLVAQAPGIVEGFWGIPAGRGADDAAAAFVNALFTRVIRERAQVGAQPEARVPPLGDPADTKAHFRALLAELDRSPPNTPYRVFVLTGALAELLLRSRVTPALADRLRAEIRDADTRDEAEAEAVLSDLLRRIVA